MATRKIYSALSLIGGITGSLDSLNGSLLNNDDICITVTSAGVRYWHILDADSALAESSPDVVVPDDNAGDKRWILSSVGDITVHDHADADGGGTISYNDLDDLPSALPAASVSGVNTGTATTSYVTPDALAGSNLGTKTMIITVFPYPVTPTIGDYKVVIPIPLELNGMNLVAAHAFQYTNTSIVGVTTVSLLRYRVSTGVENDMLSTSITIDTGESSSYTAATPPVINTSYDDVIAAVGTAHDHISICVDSVATGANGLTVNLSFRLP